MSDARAPSVEDLTASQRAAVLSDAAPLCVQAGAGSGKTTVLTRRVARRILDGSARAEHVLVVTFTRKAARELRARLWTLGADGPVTVSTFHGAAYAQLRQRWSDTSARRPGIVETRALLHRMLRSTDAGVDEVDRAATEIQWAQARLVAPSGYVAAAVSAQRSCGVPAGRVAELYDAYLERKARRGVLDLHDVLVAAADMLENDDRVAAAWRWSVRHLFVDEFQDVNPAQWRLVRAWLGERSDLFVVGDPNQAVYGWNGADPTLIDRLPRLLPGTTVMRLDVNHRCSHEIVHVARSVLDHRITKRPPPRDPPGGERVSLDPASGPRAFEGVSATGVLPVLRGFDDDEEEAAALARWIRRAHRPGLSWSRLAVLARTHARLVPVARAFERARIPHRTASAGRQEEAVRSALARLRRTPPSTPLRAVLAEVAVDVDSGVPSSLARLADEHVMEDADATVGSFLAWLAATEAGDDLDGCSGDDRVELTTFHRAKGLQWATVAVVGMEDGTVPVAHAVTPDARAEERRLLYVALTRPEQELWCSWAARRHHDGATLPRSPSPLLEPMAHAVQELVRTGSVIEPRLRVAQLRARLPAAG